ncbi:unnamed protein product [Moneuplotes crassus]|uniref:Uncharacterized protein n=1 Tax=Euplotes crassus TaxID=5936 RepID=A0AAD1UPC6_EUPCR|nr:unnamed protein product [Moneuplotes crassus]
MYSLWRCLRYISSLIFALKQSLTDSIKLSCSGRAIIEVVVGGVEQMTHGAECTGDGGSFCRLRFCGERSEFRRSKVECICLF